MKIYLVGGAVRDKLLGIPVKERDWVVVGATVEDMLAAGFRQVGKEFPVFLHPKTHEEYALARMERKTAPGYKGFSFDTSPTVTLEEDLMRRDLTVNAMAMEKDSDVIIDPFHGKQDLKAKVLRHVSAAFAEDPVRILRISRFFARYSHLGFQIAPKTMALMQEMVHAGEANALVPERVWKEFERALSEKNPEKFFVALEVCGALSLLFSPIDLHGPGMPALMAATKLTAEKLPNEATVIRFAALLHALPDPKKSIPTLCKSCRAPNSYRDLALLTALHYQEALNFSKLSADQLLAIFNALDIYRREARFQDFLDACKAIALARNQKFDEDSLQNCAQVAKSVNVQALLNEGLTGEELAAKLKDQRREKLDKWLQTAHQNAS